MSRSTRRTIVLAFGLTGLVACAAAPKTVLPVETPSTPTTFANTTTAAPTTGKAIVQVRTALSAHTTLVLTDNPACSRTGSDNLQVTGKAPDGTNLTLKLSNLQKGSFPVPGTPPQPHVVQLLLNLGGKQLLTQPDDGSLVLFDSTGQRGELDATKFGVQPSPATTAGRTATTRVASTVSATVKWQCI